MTIRYRTTVVLEKITTTTGADLASSVFIVKIGEYAFPTYANKFEAEMFHNDVVDAAKKVIR